MPCLFHSTACFKTGRGDMWGWAWGHTSGWSCGVGFLCWSVPTWSVHCSWNLITLGQLEPVFPLSPCVLICLVCEACDISLSCNQKNVFPFHSFPFTRWHMMTPFLLQLFRRPSRINTQESCKEIWIWRKKKKKKKTKQKNKLKTHPCQTFWHKGATVTTC